MKIMFSAGEASGDIHAAGIAGAIRTMHPEADMLGMGGSKMAAEGVRIVYDIKNLGFIGIAEIVKALPSFFKLRSYLKDIMITEKPDVFVCVDYPGFNMKMIKVAHELGIPVVYYICPTIWAWHKSRGKTIAKYVTKVASIFPFEAKAYEEFGADVEFVGHPLVDIVKPLLSYEESLLYFNANEEAKRVLLLPGSRRQEVLGLLPIMMGAAEKAAQQGQRLQFFLPRAHTIDREEIDNILQQYNVPVTVTDGNTYDLMQICHVALAASGTVTLETALMGLPTVLLYKVAPLTYGLGKLLVHIKMVGLPNIVAGREVIPEFIQGAANVDNVEDALEKLLSDNIYYTTMKKELAEVKELLGQPGAVKRVAELIVQTAEGGQGIGSL